MRDCFPATRFSFRAHRRTLTISLLAGLAGVVFQWVVIGFGGIAVARFFPLYVLGWILPAPVALAAARDRTSGRWQATSLSAVRSSDMWFAQLVPGVSWIWVAAVMCIPYWRPTTKGLLPIAQSTDILAPSPWMYLGGVIACGLFYMGLAVTLGLRAHSTRRAIIATYGTNLILSYSASALIVILAIMGIGKGPIAIQYALIFEPQALFAPAWIVGGTIYHALPAVVGRHVVEITVCFYVGLAVALGALSYQTVCRARRPNN